MLETPRVGAHATRMDRKSESLSLVRSSGREAGMERLSAREGDILRLVAKGLASKEIATRLSPPCAEETVKGHLSWNS